MSEENADSTIRYQGPFIPRRESFIGHHIRFLQPVANLYIQLGQYENALDLIGTNNTSLKLWMLGEMLTRVEWTHGSPDELGTEHRDVLVRLVSSFTAREIILERAERLFNRTVTIYFPSYAREFWETFIGHWRGMINKNEFLTRVTSAIKRRLYHLLETIDQHRLGNEPDKVKKKHREEFGQLVLTAVKPLRCDSVSCSRHHGSADESASLFSKAVSLGLLSEAVLLYDTGSVCPKELAALAQDQDVQKMITGDDRSSMAEFLRRVVNQPPSLKSCCRVQLARRLGDDLQGRLDRARSLGLPTSLCGSLVNLHQTKWYMRSVNEDYADSSVKENETESMKTESDSDFKALSQLIDF